MIVHVQLFAGAREAIDADCVTVALPDEATYHDLADTLTAKHPQLAALVASARFASNAEFVSSTQQIDAKADIALIPPVSGG